ncbi:uncharacterized protein MYCFIDRAFT_135265 [Pseudocercospora fijiensis CIRAD86]|uniref:GrpB domain protein n=1 Tax=Pseudocercospora fijiensis (strain CIRAD86) TaxID=383855 RepID=M3AHS4_PSEFD|nr:uncharacterized protein MYCFIDRAFT_135265 [Pseudocercospora fijiensis CIRAD86]EME84141.1 hypothetical protein MYCFIDRAFT_135265 [Pseudocercospora fijiensis CIRAD86]
MPLPTVEDILKITHPPPDDGKSTERIAHRKNPYKVSIVEYNPLWPERFLSAKSRIEIALAPATALEIHHVGSTSVPDLPAKDIIDIDLVVKDVLDEASYVPALEAANFRFLLREPAWHQHRFFVDEGDWEPEAFLVNLHVFGPECAEVARHQIFRNWLREHPEDLELYARVKRECAEATEQAGESMQEYTSRKDKTIDEIRNRAFRELGYIK